MDARRGERLGWTVGWAGGFAWVLVLSAVLAVRGRGTEAAVGLLVCLVGGGAITGLAPWRHPTARYGWLMAPIYLLFFTAVAWGVWALGSAAAMGIHGWASAFLLLPILGPLWLAGRRTWDTG